MSHLSVDRIMMMSTQLLTTSAPSPASHHLVGRVKSLSMAGFVVGSIPAFLMASGNLSGEAVASTTCTPRVEHIHLVNER